MSNFPRKSLNLTSSGRSIHSKRSASGFSHPLAEEVACNNLILAACHCPLLGDAVVTEAWSAAEGARQENLKGLIDFTVLL